MNFVRGLSQFIRPIPQVLSGRKIINSNYIRPNFAVQCTSYIRRNDLLYPVGSLRWVFWNWNKDSKSSQKALSESEKRYHHLKWLMMVDIEFCGLDILPDERTLILVEKRLNGDYVDVPCLKIPWYWRVVMKLSKSSFNVELKEKLKAAGIRQRDFSYAVAKFFAQLDHKVVLVEEVPFEKSDILKIFEEMEFNDVEEKCIRIIFSVEPSRTVHNKLESSEI